MASSIRTVRLTSDLVTNPQTLSQFSVMLSGKRAPLNRHLPENSSIDYSFNTKHMITHVG